MGDYDDLFTQTADAMCEVNRAGEIIRINGSCSQLLGVNGASQALVAFFDDDGAGVAVAVYGDLPDPVIDVEGHGDGLHEAEDVVAPLGQAPGAQVRGRNRVWKSYICREQEENTFQKQILSSLKRCMHVRELSFGRI